MSIIPGGPLYNLRAGLDTENDDNGDNPPGPSAGSIWPETLRGRGVKSRGECYKESF